jgi:DNA adenine methylase
MSPLAISKYAGSHAWLIKSQPELFPRPDLGCGVVLPFVGAGSPFFGLYADVRPVVLSDKNQRLINVYRCLRDDCWTVECELGRLTMWWREAIENGKPETTSHDRGRAFFEDVRAALDDGGEVLRAARMLFVLRAAYNGLWRVNRDGACNSPYGKPAPDTDLVRAEELREMAALLQGAETVAEDFAETLSRARRGDATYLDCPFEGTHVAYCVGAEEWTQDPRQVVFPGMPQPDARKRLAEALHDLDRRGVRWSLSDADTPVTRALYGAWPMDRIARRNSITCLADERGDDAAEGLWSNWRAAAPTVHVVPQQLTIGGVL